ncbi:MULTISPECIES: STAS domain-containing protein [unclassified Rhodococcus (in: high G+C Gram-positive bacteria)]|jgi:anti-anti-sigma factor|uniref:STAS domain-containing protein n=1 Tax=unclassified Rhodococcus (in: high G+C Gram-positive bacteria) TaxID=192944 RepID=UPI000BE32A7F
MKIHIHHYSRLDDCLRAGQDRRGGPGSTVVDIRGEIDYASAGTLRSALDAGIDSAVMSLIIDLTHSSFLGVSGAQALARANIHASANGLQLLLVAPPQCVERALEVTGLTDQFRIFPSLQRAVDENRRLRAEKESSDTRTRAG